MINDDNGLSTIAQVEDWPTSYPAAPMRCMPA